MKGYALFVVVGTMLAQPAAPRPALEGLDPVLFTEGKEEPGKESLTARHGAFLYAFASAETRARFEKDPQRYSIQLEGACARMGAPTRGNPDSATVYKGRIYIFGSQACYKAFTADPEKYLSPGPAAVWNPTPQSIAAGKSLLAKARTAAGADSGISGYTQERLVNQAKESVTAKFPNGYRRDRFFPGGSFGSLVTKSEVYSLGQNVARKETGVFAAAISQEWQRDPLHLLLGAGTQEVYLDGENTLAVRSQGVVFHAVFDPQTLVIQETRYAGRGPDGFAGEYRITYGDWRTVDQKLRLPFRAEVRFNDVAVPSRSWTVEKYTVNPSDLEALVQPPSD